MTFDALPVSSQELEINAIRESESTPEEEIALEKEPTTEDLELEEPTVPDDDQQGYNDPVRLYLQQIGRVQLLTARDEKIAARRIEMEQRVSGIKKTLEKQGKQASASQIFLEIIRETRAVLGNYPSASEKSGVAGNYQFPSSNNKWEIEGGN